MFFLCQLARLTFISSGLWRDISGWKDFVSWAGACSPDSCRVHSFSRVLWQHMWLPQCPAPAPEAVSPEPDSCKAQWSTLPSSQQLPQHAFGQIYSSFPTETSACSPPYEQLTPTRQRADCQQVRRGEFLDNSNSTESQWLLCYPISPSCSVSNQSGSQPWGHPPPTVSQHWELCLLPIAALPICSTPLLFWCSTVLSLLLPRQPLVASAPCYSQ